MREPSPPSEEFRSTFGRALTVAVGVVCGVTLVGLAVSDGVEGVLRGAPWLLLVAGSCWACFWRPAVVVDDAGVRLVNVLRTIDVPWPAIRAVDTKWALTLVTAYGRFTSWAAPAPGRREATRATRQDAAVLPPGTATAEGIRPGDLPSSASGSAALLVRRRWERLRREGHLDEPRLERERVPVRWHVGTIVGAIVLSALCVVGLVV